RTLSCRLDLASSPPPARRPHRAPLVISGGISAILPRMAHARRVKSVKAAHLSPARDHILALMREQLEAIRAHEPGTRAGADPEELHRMRTAVRRLRAILGATREMFDPQWLGGLRRELDWLGTVLGGLRDLDVFRQRL